MMEETEEIFEWSGGGKRKWRKADWGEYEGKENEKKMRERRKEKMKRKRVKSGIKKMKMKG